MVMAGVEMALVDHFEPFGPEGLGKPRFDRRLSGHFVRSPPNVGRRRNAADGTD
jgi:hypothetical protein